MPTAETSVPVRAEYHACCLSSEPLPGESGLPITRRRDEHDHVRGGDVEQARQPGPLDDVAAGCVGCLLLKLSHSCGGRRIPLG